MWLAPIIGIELSTLRGLYIPPRSVCRYSPVAPRPKLRWQGGGSKLPCSIVDIFSFLSSLSISFFASIFSPFFYIFSILLSIFFIINIIIIMVNRRLSDISAKELRSLKKEELIKLIAGSCGSSSPMNNVKSDVLPTDKQDSNKPTASLAFEDIKTSFQQCLENALAPIMQKIESLESWAEKINRYLEKLDASCAESLSKVQEDINTVSHELNNVHKNFISPAQSNTMNAWNNVKTHQQENQLNNVKRHVQSDESGCEVILSNLKEEGIDHDQVKKLCSEMKFDHPKDIQRLGKRENNPSRLLKLSFNDSFTASAFRSRFEQCRVSEEDFSFCHIRVRASYPREVRVTMAKSKRTCYELNKRAKEEKLAESYSVRRDGEIWRFCKALDGGWIRDREWKQPSKIQGNF